MNHQMQMAKVAPKAARRLGLSSNHHARVWCLCMDHPVKPRGYYSGRPTTVINDPRRLGSYDSLGVVDLRVPNSGLDLFRQHVKETP